MTDDKFRFVLFYNILLHIVFTVDQTCMESSVDEVNSTFYSIFKTLLFEQISNVS